MSTYVLLLVAVWPFVGLCGVPCSRVFVFVCLFLVVPFGVRVVALGVVPVLLLSLLQCQCLLLVSRLVFAQTLGSCAWRGSGSGVTSRPDPTVCGRVCACGEKLGLRPAQSRCAGLAGGCCLTVLVFVSWGLRRPRLSRACGRYVPRCLCSRASPAAARLASSIESAVSITIASIFSLIPLRPGYIFICEDIPTTQAISSIDRVL